MRTITKNKSAYFNYEIKDTYDCWIVLKWFEVKSIKSWKININEAICKFEKYELFIYNMDIPLYSKTPPKQMLNYQPKWVRKILLKKKELLKIFQKFNEWFHIVPIEVYENKRFLIKIKIWIWKHTKKYEKKTIIKERQIKIEADKEIKMLKIG